MDTSLFCLKREIKKKNGMVEIVEKYERTTRAYFIETHMKTLQQSQLHIVKYHSV